MADSTRLEFFRQLSPSNSYEGCRYLPESVLLPKGSGTEFRVLSHRVHPPILA